MSVLKNKRDVSKVEFINTAFNLYIEVLNFTTRLSARYSRTLGNDTACLAFQVFENAEKGNAYYPNTPDRIAMRKKHFEAARASLKALDASLGICYRVMNLNPGGCFTDSKGKSISSSEAIKRLDNMAQRLGDMIDKEEALLVGIIKSLP